MNAVGASTSSPPKLVIIGLGLIGGSLAAAYQQAQKNSALIQREIIGVVRRQSTADYAVEHNIVHRAVLSFEEIAAELGEHDIVVIAVPTLSVESTLQTIKQTNLSDKVTLTDGASVKGNVVSAVNNVYGKHIPQFVPGHPIAGSEQSGVEASNPDLYQQHRVILTPLDETDVAHLDKVTVLWQSVGAEVLTMPVDEHDAVLAATSHLPHAIAYSLVDTLANDSENENIFRYAAGGFRDFTRIASSDPKMWHDIMCANREAILDAIDLFQNNLNGLRDAIDQQDSEKLLAIFSRAKSARDQFSSLINQHTNRDQKS